MRKICSIILCFAIFLSSFDIAVSADDAMLQPIIGGDVGDAFTIGNDAVSDRGVYDYGDDYMTMRTAIGSGNMGANVNTF